MFRARVKIRVSVRVTVRVGYIVLMVGVGFTTEQQFCDVAMPVVASPYERRIAVLGARER